MQKIKQAFTLVELIVVITVLAILGTIGFISLQGYSADARDGRRISDINNIKKSLELYALKNEKYPSPDNAQDVTYSGSVVVWQQGTIGDEVVSKIQKNLRKKPLDPSYGTEYVYSTTEDRKEYQIMSVYENLAKNDLVSSTYAAQPSSVKIDGNYNGLFVKNGGYIIPAPSIITSLDPTGLDFDAEAIKSQVVEGGKNIPNMGTEKIIQSTGSLVFADFEVYNGNLTDSSDNNNFLGAYNAIASTYSGSSIEDYGIIEACLSKTTEDEKIAFTKVVVLEEPKYAVSSSSSGGDESCESGFVYYSSVGECLEPTNESYFTFSAGEITDYDTSGGTDVVIPSQIGGESVTSFGADAFRGNSLISIVIPDSVVSLGAYSLSYNNFLSVIIPDGVTSIGSSAFKGNSMLTNVVIPDSVTSIGATAFANSSIETVNIPNGLTAILAYTFYDNNLTNLIIPDSVTTIGYGAFYENSLVSITIPGSVTTIEGTAFTLQTGSVGGGTVYGPASGYVYDLYNTGTPDSYFDMTKLTNYVSQ